MPIVSQVGIRGLPARGVAAAPRGVRKAARFVVRAPPSEGGLPPESGRSASPALSCLEVWTDRLAPDHKNPVAHADPRELKVAAGRERIGWRTRGLGQPQNHDPSFQNRIFQALDRRSVHVHRQVA
jgi:hypothetical protein